MKKKNMINMICALGGTNAVLKILLSKKGSLKKTDIKEVYDNFDEKLSGYEKEIYASEDWERVMSDIDKIRQIPDEEFILKGDKRRLVIDRFEINRYGTFWVFWYGQDQHIISFEHIPNKTSLSRASSYFDALEKSVNAYYQLKSELEHSTYQLTND